MEDQAPYAPADVLAPYAVVLAAADFCVEARHAGQPVLLATWQPEPDRHYEAMLYRNEQHQVYAFLTRLGPAPAWRVFSAVRLEAALELSWLLERTRPTLGLCAIALAQHPAIPAALDVPAGQQGQDRSLVTA